MKKILAIINLIAAIPLIVNAFVLVFIMLNAETFDPTNEPDIIGGADGPTAIFLSCDPAPVYIGILGLYAGLFILNGIVFWNSKGKNRTRNT